MLLSTGFSSRQTADQIYDLLVEAGFTEENARYVATGYGRVSVPYADQTVTEITCHAKGAQVLFGGDGTVIDIGGQDTKGIALKNGRVMKFIMNDKCSAGTGKFLEVMTNRLGLTQQELSELGVQGQAHFHQLHVHGICGVGGDQPDRQGNAQGRYRLRGHRVRGDKSHTADRADSGGDLFSHRRSVRGRISDRAFAYCIKKAGDQRAHGPIRGGGGGCGAGGRRERKLKWDVMSCQRHLTNL